MILIIGSDSLFCLSPINFVYIPSNLQFYWRDRFKSGANLKSYPGHKELID